MNLVAAICLAAVVGLLVPRSARSRLARLRPAEPSVGGRTLPRVGVVAVFAAPVVGGLVLAGSAGATIGLCFSMLIATVAGLWRRHRREARAAQRREEVVDGCQLLAGLLRVGHVPVTALRIAAADTSIFAEAVAAQQVGGSVPGVLRKMGTEPGRQGLGELASAWDLADLTGASLTATLDALAERLDAARRISRVVSAELAAPRATGRLMAALPAFGLALGYAIGGDPGRFLLGSPLGQGCLILGVTLACGGVWWVELIASSGGD